MARQATISYWASRGGYGCWIRGRQRILAKGAESPETYQAAAKAFAELSALANQDQLGDQNTMWVVMEAYLCHLTDDRHLAPGTLRLRETHFKIADAAFGDVAAGKLTHVQVYELCRHLRAHGSRGQHPRLWGDGACRNLIADLHAACAWAVRARLLATNPLAGIEMPAAHSRGDEAFLSAAQVAQLKQAAPGYLRDLIVVLELTGARPGEIINATAADYKPARRALVYPASRRLRQGRFRHKNARGGDRIIYLRGEALLVVERLLKTQLEGPLFRGRNGTPWTGTALSHCFASLRRRLKLPGLTPYCLRHTFATNWLESGRSVEKLAVLMGNSPKVIHLHYSHLASNALNPADGLEDFIAASESGRADPQLVAS